MPTKSQRKFDYFKETAHELQPVDPKDEGGGEELVEVEKWRWRLLDGEGDQIALSDGSFDTKADAKKDSDKTDQWLDREQEKGEQLEPDLAPEPDDDPNPHHKDYPPDDPTPHAGGYPDEEEDEE